MPVAKGISSEHAWANSETDEAGDGKSQLIAAEWPFQGFADHLVSEALYLADPNGNGLELYVDRPRALWVQQRGQIEMEILSNVVDRHAIGGEYPRSGYEQLLRLQLGL